MITTANYYYYYYGHDSPMSFTLWIHHIRGGGCHSATGTVEVDGFTHWLRKDGKRMSHYDTHHSANARPPPPPPPRTNLEVWPEHPMKLINKIFEQLFAHSSLH